MAPTGRTPARATSASRWCRTRKPRPRRCTAWSRCWDEGDGPQSMTAIDRGMTLSSWSDDLRSLLRRRVSEVGGVALIALSLVMAVALATWSVQDPSFSHATGGPARNLLGTPGAIGADLLMQLF